MNKKTCQKTGFTLPELIIVLGVAVAITGILFVAIDPQAILAKSRDAERIQDLDELNKALQLSLAEELITLEDTSDCDSCTTLTGSFKVDGKGWVKFNVMEETPGLRKYLNQLPIDSLNEKPYVYEFVANGQTQKFKLSVPLESADNANKMRLDGGVSPGLYEIGTDLSL
ncbi:hypothetical protein GF360_03860 [candidate division WWE3 bacterium]|nr:hypothetical protein [candidate division WWE3 bacterium]